MPDTAGVAKIKLRESKLLIIKQIIDRMAVEIVRAIATVDFTMLSLS